ncbi:unnamed protein product [Rhizophagus irregularis]|nr:unnamed protein product [Rhizophagus irregularis]
MAGWKYSKQRLQKNPFVAKVACAKKVICVCGAAIKLNRKYDEDYINRHANGLGCNRKKQQSILCFFNPIVTDKEADDEDNINSDDDWNDWESEVEDTMDDDDIITVDENDEEINGEGNVNIEIISPETNQTGRKRKPCLGLRSDLIAKYVDRTPASYGGAHRVEVIAKEMYPKKFPHKFTRKKLKLFQKRALNRKIYAESQWRVDKDCVAVRAKECIGYSESGKTICDECLTLKYNPILNHRLTIPKPAPENLKFTPKFYFENNSLKKHLQNQDLREIWTIIKDDYDTNVWITLADKANNGAFKEKPVFTGLCDVMVQAAIRKDNNKGKQNIQYNEDFTNFLIILESFSTRALDLFRQNLEGRTIQNIRKLQTNNEDTLTNPALTFENVAKFKRLIDTLNYRGPIVAMSDNTKLKPALRYSSILGCIIGSTLPIEQTKINTYEDIQPIINDIKTKKAIAKDVRAYILQIPLPNFSPVIIALIANDGSDNASTITSFHQELLTQIAPQLNLPILSIGSDGAIVKFKAQVAIQSYSTNEQLTFQNKKLGVDFSCPVFPNIGPVIRVQDPKHAKKTSRNAIMSGARLLTLGKSTARFEQLLKLSNLLNSVMYRHDVIKLDRQDDGAAYRVFCSRNLQNCRDIEDTQGLFVYLFIMGELIDSYLNREITPLERIKIFAIFTSLAEFMVLLVKTHREYYPNYPFLPWMHGSEACEHFFGMARQINSDFNYSELLQLVPKISQCAKALRTKNIILEKEKSVREGYHFDYNIGNINASKLITLCTWPSDTDITSTIKTSYKLASDLAKALDMNSTPNEKSLQPFILIEEQNLEVSTGIELSSNNPDEFFEIDREVSDAISQASKHTTNTIDNVFNFSNIENENINDQNYQQQIISTLNNTTRIFQQLTPHDFSINRYLLPIGELDYSTMIALRKRHEAYNSRPVERQNHTHAISHEQTNTINPNKASHIISHFTNNDNPEMRFIKQREKRWKENWKTMTANLANLQQNELSKRKRIDKVASEIMCIESANITQDFPLQQNDYVIVLKVIAMYYEGYGNHCYSQNAVTQIEDLSYISLQIYLPIHLNIFASQTVEGYTLFTHHCPQNIIYHIKSNGLIIGDSSLTLTGVARNIFNYFNRDTVKNSIINMM